MLCKQCKTENPDHAAFCQKCGQELKAEQELQEAEELKDTDENVQEDEATAEESADSNIGMEEEAPKNKRKQQIIGGVILLVAIMLCIAVLVVYNSQKEKRYNAKLDSAGNYIQQMDYEKAEAAYLEAIKIDPKQEEPYLQLANLYMKQGKKEKAIEILKKGKEKTSGKTITNKIEEIQGPADQEESGKGFLQEQIVEEVGLADLGTFPDDESNRLGLVSAWLQDVNGDGNTEILTTVSENHKATDFRITLYEKNKETFAEIAELKAEQSEQMGDTVKYGDSSHQVFVKKQKNSYYLVIYSSGADQGYSSSSSKLVIYALDDKMTQCCTLETFWYRGSQIVTIDDKEIFSLSDEELSDLSEEAMTEKRQDALEQMKEALEPYGLEEKAKLSDPEDIVIGLQIGGFDSESETETCLSNRQRNQNGEYDDDEGHPIMEVVVEDFTDLRALLGEDSDTAFEPEIDDETGDSVENTSFLDCIGMSKGEIEEKYGPLTDTGEYFEGGEIYTIEGQEGPEFLFSWVDDVDDSVECTGAGGSLDTFFDGLEETMSKEELEGKLGIEVLEELSSQEDEAASEEFRIFYGILPQGLPIRIFPGKTATFSPETSCIILGEQTLT